MLDTLTQLALLLGKLSLLAFGSSATILAELQREVVDHGWMTQGQFAEAYALSQIAPGPGTLFVIPVGYQAAGLAGAMIAAVAYFAPTTALALASMTTWRSVRTSRWPRAIRAALTPVALGLILSSVYVLGHSTIHSLPQLLFFLVATVALLRTSVPVPVVMASAAMLGALMLNG